MKTIKMCCLWNGMKWTLLCGEGDGRWLLCIKLLFSFCLLLLLIFIGKQRNCVHNFQSTKNVKRPSIVLNSFLNADYKTLIFMCQVNMSNFGHLPRLLFSSILSKEWTKKTVCQLIINSVIFVGNFQNSNHHNFCS